MPRPAKGPRVLLGTRTHPAVAEDLRAVASRRGQTVSDYLASLVDNHLQELRQAARTCGLSLEDYLAREQAAGEEQLPLGA